MTEETQDPTPEELYLALLLNPNADEAWIAAHSEETAAFVNGILTSVQTFLKKIGLVLFAFTFAAAVTEAGTPDPVAPQSTSAVCPDCPPVINRVYEYQDSQRVVQVPRITERHIIPRVTEVVEYVDQEQVITEPEQVICACPETQTYSQPMTYSEPTTSPATVTADQYKPGLGRIATRRLNWHERLRAKLINRRLQAHHSNPPIQGHQGI